jgi:hypothetical protein
MAFNANIWQLLLSLSTYPCLLHSRNTSSSGLPRKEGYSTPSDFIRDLIREDKRRQEQTRLERLLLEGLESGSERLTPEEWKALKKAVLITNNESIGRPIITSFYIRFKTLC